MVHAVIAYQISSVLNSTLGFDEPAGSVLATSQALGILLLLLYVGLVLLASQLTFSYVEDPFRRKAKAWVASRAVFGVDENRLPHVVRSTRDVTRALDGLG